MKTQILLGDGSQEKSERESEEKKKNQEILIALQTNEQRKLETKQIKMFLRLSCGREREIERDERDGVT